MADMEQHYISKITLPSGTSYDIKDAQAWADIAALSATVKGGVHYIGKTTTELSDGTDTNPITIGGASVSAEQGDMVSYTKGSGTEAKDLEFIFNGANWYELGSTGSLKALAFKDSASGTITFTPTINPLTATLTADVLTSTGKFTPSGTIALSGTTNLTATSESYTPAGTITAPSFTNGSASVTATYQPKGSVTLSGATEQAVSITATVDESGNYKPAGTITQPEFTNGTITGTASYTQVTGVTTKETKNVGITIGSGTANYTPAGTVSGNFVGAEMTSSGTFKPAGTVTVGMTTATVTVAGQAPATGDEATYTPDGTVDAPEINVATAGATDTVNSATALSVVTDMDVVDPNTTVPEGKTELAYYSVTGETLTFKKFIETTGASITTTPKTVKTGDATYTATAPGFTGTGVKLVTGSITVPDGHGTFEGSNGTVSVKGTTTGSLSDLVFGGTGTVLQVAVPDKYDIATTTASAAVTGTATGTVTQPEFKGTTVSITANGVNVPTGATFSGTEETINSTGTATGTIGEPTFKGTAATIKVPYTNPSGASFTGSEGDVSVKGTPQGTVAVAPKAQEVSTTVTVS